MFLDQTGGLWLSEPVALLLALVVVSVMIAAHHLPERAHRAPLSLNVIGRGRAPRRFSPDRDDPPDPLDRVA